MLKCNMQVFDRPGVTIGNPAAFMVVKGNGVWLSKHETRRDANESLETAMAMPMSMGGYDELYIVDAKGKVLSSKSNKGRSGGTTCSRKIRVQRKGYTRRNGTVVKPTTFTQCDPGTPGRRTRGSKAGPFKKQAKWVQHAGTLGGLGYTKRPERARRQILRDSVDFYGYASTSRKLHVILRSTTIHADTRRKVEADAAWLKATYRPSKKGRSTGRSGAIRVGAKVTFRDHAGKTQSGVVVGRADAKVFGPGAWSVDAADGRRWTLAKDDILSASSAGRASGAARRIPGGGRAARSKMGLGTNYTVVIPYTKVGKTEWHPTKSTGPFSKLTRGSFKTRKQAASWAKQHLGETRYSIKRIDSHLGRSGGQEIAQKDRGKLLAAIYRATNVSDKMLRKGKHTVMLVGGVAERYGVTSYHSVVLEDLSNAELLRLGEAYKIFKSQRGRSGGVDERSIFEFWLGKRLITAVIATNKDEALAKAIEQAPIMADRPRENPTERVAALRRATVRSRTYRH